jgi:hypothetical protein
LETEWFSARESIEIESRVVSNFRRSAAAFLVSVGAPTTYLNKVKGMMPEMIGSTAQSAKHFMVSANELSIYANFNYMRSLKLEAPKGNYVVPDSIFDGFCSRVRNNMSYLPTGAVPYYKIDNSDKVVLAAISELIYFNDGDSSFAPGVTCRQFAREASFKDLRASVARTALQLIRFLEGKVDTPPRLVNRVIGKSYDPIPLSKLEATYEVNGEKFAGRHRNLILPDPAISLATKYFTCFRVVKAGTVDVMNYDRLIGLRNGTYLHAGQVPTSVVGVNTTHVVAKIAENWTTFVGADVAAWDHTVPPPVAISYFASRFHIINGFSKEQSIAAGSFLDRVLCEGLYRVDGRFEFRLPFRIWPSGALDTLVGNSEMHSFLLEEGGVEPGSYCVAGDDLAAHPKYSKELLIGIYHKNHMIVKKFEEAGEAAFCSTLIEGGQSTVDIITRLRKALAKGTLVDGLIFSARADVLESISKGALVASE